jgi:predicted heme/steroid binding protein
MLRRVYLVLFCSVCALAIDASGVRVVKKEELESKNGKDSEELWLSILGSVYDVSAGKMYYGEGGPYSIFVGRDGSASFISGEFTPEGSNKPLTEFTPRQLKSLDDWRKFYEDDEKYHFVGFLEGDYYDKDGKPTAEMERIQEAIAQGEAEREAHRKETEEKIKKRKEKDAQKANDEL